MIAQSKAGDARYHRQKTGSVAVACPGDRPGALAQEPLLGPDLSFRWARGLEKLDWVCHGPDSQNLRTSPAHLLAGLLVQAAGQTVLDVQAASPPKDPAEHLVAVSSGQDSVAEARPATQD